MPTDLNTLDDTWNLGFDHYFRCVYVPSWEFDDEKHLEAYAGGQAWAKEYRDAIRRQNR